MHGLPDFQCPEVRSFSGKTVVNVGEDASGVTGCRIRLKAEILTIMDIHGGITVIIAIDMPFKP
jgi:hypothetical protein